MYKALSFTLIFFTLFYLAFEPVNSVTLSSKVQNELSATVQSGPLTDEAIAEGLHGDQRLYIKLDESGKVSDCWGRQSSNDEKLERISCQILRSRAILKFKNKPKDKYRFNFYWPDPKDRKNRLRGKKANPKTGFNPDVQSDFGGATPLLNGLSFYPFELRNIVSDAKGDRTVIADISIDAEGNITNCKFRESMDISAGRAARVCQNWIDDAAFIPAIDANANQRATKGLFVAHYLYRDLTTETCGFRLGKYRC